MLDLGEFEAKAVGTPLLIKCFISRVAPGRAFMLHHLNIWGVVNQEYLTQEENLLAQVIIQCDFPPKYKKIYKHIEVPMALLFTEHWSNHWEELFCRVREPIVF
jgi:hypothetical protein